MGRLPKNKNLVEIRQREPDHPPDRRFFHHTIFHGLSSRARQWLYSSFGSVRLDFAVTVCVQVRPCTQLIYQVSQLTATMVYWAIFHRPSCSDHPPVYSWRPDERKASSNYTGGTASGTLRPAPRTLVQCQTGSNRLFSVQHHSFSAQHNSCHFCGMVWFD